MTGGVARIVLASALLKKREDRDTFRCRVDNQKADVRGDPLDATERWFEEKRAGYQPTARMRMI
jgi:hypothetical protein